MIAADRDALLCDLAETYGIYDMKALPVPILATLSVGLRDTSRIKMIISGTKIPREEMLLAGIVDRLSLLVWQQTKDGREGVNQPKSVLNILLGKEQPGGGAVEAFESADEFEREWERITGVSHGTE